MVFGIPSTLVIGALLSSGLADARLDAVLRAWQKADKKVCNRHFTYKRTEERVTFGAKETLRAEVFVHKPNLIRLDEMDKTGKTSGIYLCNVKSIHRYDFATRSELVFELPDSFGFPGKPEQYPTELLDGLLGEFLERITWICEEWPVWKQKARFSVKLIKGDKYWIYLDVKPRRRQRCFDFEEARVVLDAGSYRVREIWIRHGNDDTTTWDFGDADIDQEPVTVDSITSGLPKDWERRTVPVSK